MSAVATPAGVVHSHSILVHTRRLGRVDYAETVEAMRAFTAARGAASADELWLLEHPPVYTLGQGADPAHGPRVANGIPVERCGRGGEVTYHGPGQIVLYTLVDLARRGIKVREFVRLLEASVIALLAEHGVRGASRAGAPGVYVGDGPTCTRSGTGQPAKVAALGIRVTRGCAWHGLALNVDMDLAPFDAIDPCGHPGLRVTQTRDLGIAAGSEALGGRLAEILVERMERTERTERTERIEHA